MLDHSVDGTTGDITDSCYSHSKSDQQLNLEHTVFSKVLSHHQHNFFLPYVFWTSRHIVSFTIRMIMLVIASIHLSINLNATITRCPCKLRKESSGRCSCYTCLNHALWSTPDNDPLSPLRLNEISSK